jgi:hypothetical protein
MYMYGWISHGGSCALATGKATSVTAIVAIRNKAIVKAVLSLAIFPISPFIL